jgi:hypothetical protein
VTKIDVATMAKADKAEAVKVIKEAAPIDEGKMAAEVASMSPLTEDRLGGSWRGEGSPYHLLGRTPQATWKGGDGC